MAEEKNKPVLDEQTLAKLLEAAYVLQEHNRELHELELGLDLKREQLEAESKAQAAPPAKPPQSTKKREAEAASHADYTFTLAQIVATQHQIQIRHLDLEKAMELVTERVTEIASATGAAIGLLDGKKVRYRTAAGLHTLTAGTVVSMQKALCLPCIRDGQVFRCGDVNPEFLVDNDECRRRGIQSLIAVPIFHEGEVAGGLEVYYSGPRGFAEQDVHTCQLMAGLVTEALARDEEHNLKQSLANERAVVLQALEKLKPNLSAIVDAAPAQEPARKPAAATAREAVYTCTQCGNQLVGGEQFCGQCGMPRSAEGASSMQSKVASSLRILEAQTDESPSQPSKREKLPEKAPQRMQEPAPEAVAEAADAHLPKVFEVPFEEVPADEAVAAEKSPAHELLSDEVAASDEHALSIPQLNIEAAAEKNESESVEEEVALAKVGHPENWGSAASAREFLEQLAAGQRQSALARFWDRRRGDIYLAVAVILVACVIRWGIWSNHSVVANGTPAAPAAGHAKSKPAPDADLSAFDRMLISLGLAEAPEPPADIGNPSVQVWVDLHTALYYCPGADLYGKTAKGRYASQRDAQLDQYEPAYRKPCH